jgi:hypothetical protein
MLFGFYIFISLVFCKLLETDMHFTFQMDSGVHDSTVILFILVSVKYKHSDSIVYIFFSTNNENHNLDTRQRYNLYLPRANLTIYQKGAYYSGIKIFNNLPLEIKNTAGNQKKI